VPEVRVIGADGAQIGIIPTQEALRMAEEQGLELVEVNPRAAPPVCRIMDYGKFKYETSKKEKASRKHQSTVVVKEIKLRPKTDVHDLDFKVKHIRRFLDEGNKCKLVIVFRGREIVHPETGQAMLDAVVKHVSDIATVEQRALMEGRRMVMVIGPKTGVIRAAGAPGSVPAAPITRPIPPPAGPIGRPNPSSAGGAARPNPAPAAGAARPMSSPAGGGAQGGTSSGPTGTPVPPPASKG
jgi:translation initiation factor IF-3